MVVGRVQPEETVEDRGTLVEPLKPPEAEAIAAETAQERAVVDQPPGENAVKIRRQGEFADADTYLIVTNGVLGGDLER